MAFDHRAPVLHAAVTLDGRHHQPAGKAHQVHQQGDQAGLPPGKGCDPAEGHAQARGEQHPAHKTFHGLGGGEYRCNPVSAGQLAAHVLQHVRTLHHQNQPVDQQQVAVAIIRNVQHHQRRHAGNAVDRNHQPPLHGGCARQELLRVVAQRGQNGQQQKTIDRDEHREEPIPANGNQVILQGQYQIERGDQRQMVSPPGGGDGEKLAQGKEGNAGEQQDYRPVTDGQRATHHHGHHPPRLDACVEVVDDGVRRVETHAPFEQGTDERGHHQHAEDEAVEEQGVMRHGSGAACGGTGVCRDRVGKKNGTGRSRWRQVGDMAAGGCAGIGGFGMPAHGQSR